MFVDQDGEIAWFIPVIIGAVVGAYIGGGIQSGNWNPVSSQFWQNGWQGVISGAIIGATLGYGVAGAIGATGMTTVAANGATVATKSAGLVSSMLNSGTVNIAMNAMSGGGWDGAWKAGLVGLASGAWTATGGFGMVKAWGAENAFAKLGGKLGYQMIGTAGGSIGRNWSLGKDPLSMVNVGVGPVNVTLNLSGKGKVFEWKNQLYNNIGNITTNTLGLGNLAFGGKARFDGKNLAPVYTGGLMEYMGGAWGPYSVMGPNSPSNDYFTDSVLPHEMHHIWQSRSLGDTYLLNYGLAGISSFLMNGMSLYAPYNGYNYLTPIIPTTNYWEAIADIYTWW
jgi:hypothetical protein